MRKGPLSGSLHRLIYYSRNILSDTLSPDELEAEINAIVTTSRSRNEADHLTGCLMCSASAFAGVLEGTRDTVERTFDRLSADPRHTDVMMVSLMPVERANFQGLPLALAWRAQPGMPDPLRHLFTEAVPGYPRAITGGDVLRLLRETIEHPSPASGFDDPS